MATFSELLTTYMTRTGIGDADLARRIGVNRLTLIRWKEGVTSRPRYREDVVKCADVLRLTAEEGDELLLSAGFYPENPVAPAEPPEPVALEKELLPVSVEMLPAPAPDLTPATLARRLRQRPPIRIAIVAVLALAVLCGIGAAVAFLAFGPSYPVAADGESLIVMAPFANYTGGQQGFNVRGRIRDEIDREMQAAGVVGVRTVEWPQAIASESAARDAGRRAGAAIVIWGEYDSGRAMAVLTVPFATGQRHHQQVVDITSSPAELPTTINIDLTGEVRTLALLTLGQLYLEQDKPDKAKTVLIQALARPPVDPVAMVSLKYRLGVAYQSGQLVDLDESILLFSQVLEVLPRSVDAYNSRAVAYLERGRTGDAGRAIDDLTSAMTIAPRKPTPYLNRAVAYMERGWPEDLVLAINDLDQAIALDQDAAGAHVNRAVAYLQRNNDGDVERAFADLEQAIDIQPGLAAAYLNRGNAYVQREQRGDLDLAAMEFTRAIELEPDSPMAFFNRGLVYSALGDWDRSTGDLRRAQDLDTENMAFNNTLCWQLGVQRLPESALPYCNRAVEADPDGQARDSRGVVYAVMGRNAEAIADFEAFLAWVDRSPKDSCGDRYYDSRDAWIRDLRSGQNPFNAATLLDMRARPVTASSDPC